jgi:hypothetical protein
MANNNCDQSWVQKVLQKHKAQEYLGKMETKKIIHSPIWLFKAIYNYAPFMAVPIKFSPLRRQKIE